MKSNLIISITLLIVAIGGLVNAIVGHATYVELKAYQRAVNERLAEHGEPPIEVNRRLAPLEKNEWTSFGSKS